MDSDVIIAGRSIINMVMNIVLIFQMEVFYLFDQIGYSVSPLLRALVQQYIEYSDVS